MNYTAFTDDKCATVKNKVEVYKLGECKHMLIATCAPDASGAMQANLTYFNDATCTSFNDTKIYASGVCTQTGPKAARTSKLAVCGA